MPANQHSRPPARQQRSRNRCHPATTGRLEAASRLGLQTVAAGIVLFFVGCWSDSSDSIVVYTALDQEFSAPIFDAYSSQSNTRVDAKYDIESTKTVGLTQAIIAEANRPRCDLFWNNEILNTIRLQRRGLLLSYNSIVGNAMPPQFRDPNGQWYGFAARARILLVNTNLVDESQRPSSIQDLANDQWKGRVGIAKPLFGTTATHATVLFHKWGTKVATDFFRKVKQNAQVLSGNKQVAIAVASGQLAWGLTDTDDGHVEVSKGSPVAVVYPDQVADEMGTLFIPNTVAIIAGGPHPERAKRFVEYVLSPAVERTLASGPSAQIPLNPQVQIEATHPTPATVRSVDVDFGAAADHWDEAAKVLRDLFFRVDGTN